MDVVLLKEICIIDLLFILILGFVDVIIKMSEIVDMTKKEVDNFREVIDTLHAKHKEYTIGI